MHGRKKSTEPQSEVEATATRIKGNTYNSLLDILLERRNCKTHTLETLELTAKIAKANPDFFSIWNYRREILISMHHPTTGLTNSNHIQTKISESVGGAVRDEELRLSADCIKKNPKSYAAWFHREWIAARFDINIANELELCKLFLTEDQRNFHCWNYRRHISSIGDISDDQEMRYSTEKIEENFSNYSAFHHRSVYVKKIVHEYGNGTISGYDKLKSIVEEDLAIIENAVYTEPDDQSAWWYLFFLISFSIEKIKEYTQRSVDNNRGGINSSSNSGSSSDDNNSRMVSWLNECILNQIESVRNLLQVEANSKWGMSCIVNLIDQLAVANKLSVKQMCDEDKYKVLLLERKQLLMKLIEIDKSHSSRYMYLLIKTYE